MILHTNLGVEKGSVNDIVGIRVLQQLLKVRPAEQEQFMYYDSFGIVREKLYASLHHIAANLLL
jgi:hypothetical protein